MNQAEILELLAALGMGAIPVVVAAWKGFAVIADLRTQIASLSHRIALQEQASQHLNERQDLHVETLRNNFNNLAVKTTDAINRHGRRLHAIESFLAKQLSFAPRE